jgi:hypothetical protein
MTRFGSSRTSAVLGFAVLLLVAGLLVDIAFTQPRLREVRRLRLQRDELLRQLGNLENRQHEVRAIAGLLSVETLAELRATPENTPLIFVGRLLEDSRLTRLELSAAGTSESDSFRRTRFALRVLGSYGRILEFVRTLERGPRLATVDAFAIEAATGPEALEGRLNISIYDPRSNDKP